MIDMRVVYRRCLSPSCPFIDHIIVPKYLEHSGFDKGDEISTKREQEHDFEDLAVSLDQFLS